MAWLHLEKMKSYHLPPESPAPSGWGPLSLPLGVPTPTKSYQQKKYRYNTYSGGQPPIAEGHPYIVNGGRGIYIQVLLDLVFGLHRPCPLFKTPSSPGAFPCQSLVAALPHPLLRIGPGDVRDECIT